MKWLTYDSDGFYIWYKGKPKWIEGISVYLGGAEQICFQVGLPLIEHLGIEIKKGECIELEDFVLKAKSE